MRLLRPLLMCVLVCLIGCAHAQSFTPVPPLTGHVVDQVGLLQAQERAALEKTLVDYERRTGSQIAVLIIASTEPEAIEQYSIRVADAWKLGRKGIDDGVILVIAKDNPKALRRLRIETGRGVQGTLTDAQSKRILQDVIAPHFRQNDFYGGLKAGIATIAHLLYQEKFPAPADSPAQPDREDFPMLFIALLFMGAFWLLGGSRFLNRHGWSTTGVILGSEIGRNIGRFGGRGGFSGGGGSFDGGGASGDW